LKIYRIW